MLLLQFRQTRDDGAAAGLADDVAQEENRQHLANMVLNTFEIKIVILLLSRFSHSAARLFFVLLFTAAWAGGAENISPLGQAPDWSASGKISGDDDAR